MKKTVFRMVLMLWVFWLFQSVALAQNFPPESEVKKTLQELVEGKKRSVGLVVGLIDEKGSRVISYGKLDQKSAKEVDGDTVFEIGSLSKVFTSLLLADMVERGLVNLDDPISKYLPKSVKVPTRNGQEITLLHLATHTSGLPRLPQNLAPKDSANPYADYTVEQLYEFLSSYTLTRDIGSRFEYSNLGAGLLGHILALKAGTTYETLVKKRICEPLKMNHTVVKLTPELQARLATGYDESGKAVKNWDLPTLAGAGALRSTANDLLKFVAAQLGLTKSDLTGAIQKTQIAHQKADDPGAEVGLAWFLIKDEPHLVWHNGQTGGYHSFIAFNPQRHQGVVVLSNSTNGVEDLGFSFLREKKEHREAKVDPKVFESYVGFYELAPNVVITVTKEGDTLMAQLTGQSKYQIFPESEAKFFYKVVDAQITFVKDEKGQVTGLILHQNGRNVPGKKLEKYDPPKERKVIQVDPKIYDAYVGQYQLSPNFAITVTKQGDKLMGQATGQPPFEMFPESETNFFLKVVDAQITFVKDEKGNVVQLVLHQNGQNVPGKKIQ